MVYAIWLPPDDHRHGHCHGRRAAAQPRCVRTDDAIGYAATLLDGLVTRERVNEIVRSGVTTPINLDRPLPVYLAYFTAVAHATGEVEFLPDIYVRDARITAASGASVVAKRSVAQEDRCV